MPRVLAAFTGFWPTVRLPTHARAGVYAAARRARYDLLCRLVSHVSLALKARPALVRERQSDDSDALNRLTTGRRVRRGAVYVVLEARRRQK